MKTQIPFWTALLIVGCAGATAQTPPPTVPETPAPPAVTSIPDSQIGLLKASLTDTPTPPDYTANQGEPGETQPLPRPYPTAPPVVPHNVLDFLPITKGENSCMDCHAIAKRVPGEPIPMPKSHYTNFRSSPPIVAEKPVGARYDCVACHVGRTDAPPLVGNTYSPPSAGK